MSEETLERETHELVIGRGEQVRVLRSGRDLYFVQTVKDGETKEGWVPGSWLLERGLEDQIPSTEVQEELEAGLDEDILQDLSSEASEPELQRLKDTGEGTCISGSCTIAFGHTSSPSTFYCLSSVTRTNAREKGCPRFVALHARLVKVLDVLGYHPQTPCT